MTSCYVTAGDSSYCSWCRLEKDRSSSGPFHPPSCCFENGAKVQVIPDVNQYSGRALGIQKRRNTSEVPGQTLWHGRAPMPCVHIVFHHSLRSPRTLRSPVNKTRHGEPVRPHIVAFNMSFCARTFDLTAAMRDITHGTEVVRIAALFAVDGVLFSTFWNASLACGKRARTCTIVTEIPLRENGGNCILRDLACSPADAVPY